MKDIGRLGGRFDSVYTFFALVIAAIAAVRSREAVFSARTDAFASGAC